MKSVWEQTGEHRDFAPLKGDISIDVLIIGGGMAGILCAYLLHGAGVPYVLTEAETVCGGITKNTTAKITIQHGLIYDESAAQIRHRPGGTVPLRPEGGSAKIPGAVFWYGL